jgi:hypothetical protein
MVDGFVVFLLVIWGVGKSESMLLYYRLIVEPGAFWLRMKRNI